MRAATFFYSLLSILKPPPLLLPSLVTRDLVYDEVYDQTKDCAKLLSKLTFVQSSALPQLLTPA